MRPVPTRRTLALLSAAAAVLLVGTLATRHVSSTPDVPFRHTFDGSTESWMAFGAGAEVRIAAAAEHVKTGSGALELEYEVGPGLAGSAVLPVSGAALSRLKALRFWIKSDHDTSVAVVLSETKPGGDYSAWFWLPRGQWQHIELVPTDFALNEGPGDPPDPNGRLDLDRLQGAGFIDLGQFFGLLSEDPSYPLVLTKMTGTHYLHIDDFEALDVARVDPRHDLIGDPSRGFISWITLGGAELSLSEQSPLNTAAFQASYEQTPGSYVLLAHGLSTLNLARADRLSFDIASVMPATIMVYLEERSPGSAVGPRYSTVTTLAGGSQRARTTLAISDFVHDSTGPADPDGRLTPDRLKSISLVDVDAAASGRTARNTIWFLGIEALGR